MTGPAGNDPRDDDKVADGELLRRHVDGDADAFNHLVRRHGDRLWAVALRTLGNRDDAADAVQEAWLSAFRSAATFRGDAAVTTWLHRITVNACLDRARRAKVRAADPLPPDGISDPRDRLGERETALDMLAALRQLPTEQAAALVLVDVEGWPVADAAEILEVPVGTVKSRCARGRARLAAHLLGNPAGPGPVRGSEPPPTPTKPAHPQEQGP